MKKCQLFFRGKWGTMVLLLIVVLVAWLSSIWHTRFDLTNEKRYTLSAGTKQLLQKLNGDISVDICLKGEYPAGFRKLANSTIELLDEFNEITGNSINIQLVSPSDHFTTTASTYADTLKSFGIQPITDQQAGALFQQKTLIYPIALIRSKDTMIAVRLFTTNKPFINSKLLSQELGQELNKAEALLEYQLAEGIHKVIRHGLPKPLIGYSIGHGEPEDISIASLIYEVISPEYDMITVDIEKDTVIPTQLQALVMLKPSRPFTEMENLKLDQYIMNGGKLLFFAEPLQAEMDTFRIKHRIFPFEQQLGITDLIYHYGARINPKLLLDIRCDQYPLAAASDGRTFNLIPWNCCPKLTGNINHPITENVDLVNAKFANTIDLIETRDVKGTVLLQSSAHARTLSQGDMVLGNENVTDASDMRFRLSNLPAAVLLEGKFTSYFSNSITTAQKQFLESSGMPFKSVVSNPGKILVVSDGDIVMNDQDPNGQPFSMGINKYTQGSDQEFVFANKKFIQNVLEFFTDETKNELLQARNKSYVLNLLDTQKVEKEKRKWQLINILLPILIILILALFFTQWRKRKYSN
jgi:ABC-2 type transport system permease protein